jgi:hypothetical protein
VIDFNEFPTDRYGYSAMMATIDRLSKGTWTIPCKKGVTTREAAELYYFGPFRVFGLPWEVITDRGPQFRADFVDELAKILGINWKLAMPGYL